MTDNNKFEMAATQTPDETQHPTLIVGIGASAGGLSAFKAFLSHVPADTGIAFVLLPHLDPNHKSMMTELLSGKTAMPVTSIEQGQQVCANHVYILPPDKGLTIHNGTLQLSESERPAHRWTAVDQFLTALAADQGERSVGIILSGTGSHGVSGLREIKLAGGLVLAQSLASSEYQQMPENAINTGLVDRVLEPAEMPAVLIDYARHPYLRASADEQNINPELINPILNLLRSRTKFDFRDYRKNMLIRRIQRRMSLCQIDTLEAYQQRLRASLEEVNTLIRDLLIGVTAFFRDPEVFHLLEQRVVQELVTENNGKETLRIWVPACATGEEAYSLGILFLEAFKAADKTPNVQIFATDIDERSLAVARLGVYPVGLLSDVPEQYVNQYFEKLSDETYQVRKTLREVLVFATQNVISDAPFSHLDFISCRNLLIYLEPEIQARVIQIFNFALKTNAYLLLGPSESLGKHALQFETLSKKWKLFRCRQSGRLGLPDAPFGGAPQHRTMTPISTVNPAETVRNPLGDLTVKMLLAEYAPASVLINRRYEIQQFYGPTADYLEIPSGEPTLDLLSMLRKGLGSRVRALAHRAWQEQVKIVDANARVQRNGHYVPCTVTARPFVVPQQSSSLLLLSFEDHAVEGRKKDLPLDSVKTDMDEMEVVDQLEYELKATREDLRSNVEELESSNEELKAANEEMMSMNEELQSANEELETSKEELQSMNEELNTVNAELLIKVDELECSNDDISNLLASTNIATVFINRSMQIKLFNPPGAELLNLRKSDIDRPVSDVNGRVSSTHFLADAERVLDKLSLVERVVQSLSGSGSGSGSESGSESGSDSEHRSYLRRMAPYRASNDRIGGVVVTFVDITERYQLEKTLERRVAERTQELERSKKQLSLVLHAAGAVVWEMEQVTGRNMPWQDVYDAMFGEAPGSAQDTWNWWRQRIHPDERESVEHSLQQAIASDDMRWESQYRFRMADASYHWMSDIAHISRDREGQFLRLTGAMMDINERRLAEIALAEREGRLTAIMRYAAEAMIVIDKHGLISDNNTAAEKIFGYDQDELHGLNISLLIPINLRKRQRLTIDAYLPNYLSHILNQRREFTGRRKDGSSFSMEITVAEIAEFGLFVGIVRDLTEQRLLEHEITNISTWEQERTGRELHDGLGQRLTGLTMLATRVSNNLQPLQLPENKLVTEIVSQLKEAAEEVTRISHGLAPISIRPDGLVDALANLVEPFREGGDLTCNFQGEPCINITNATVANQLYRIAQESFNNALKYARANNITLSLSALENGIELCIEDDGIGFDMQELMRRDGFGIRIMHYRAHSVGATLSIETAQGKGTHICCQYQVFPDS